MGVPDRRSALQPLPSAPSRFLLLFLSGHPRARLSERRNGPPRCGGPGGGGERSLAAGPGPSSRRGGKHRGNETKRTLCAGLRRVPASHRALNAGEFNAAILHVTCIIKYGLFLYIYILYIYDILHTHTPLGSSVFPAGIFPSPLLPAREASLCFRKDPGFGEFPPQVQGHREGTDPSPPSHARSCTGSAAPRSRVRGLPVPLPSIPAAQPPQQVPPKPAAEGSQCTPGQRVLGETRGGSRGTGRDRGWAETGRRENRKCGRHGDKGQVQARNGDEAGMGMRENGKCGRDGDEGKQEPRQEWRMKQGQGRDLPT